MTAVPTSSLEVATDATVSTGPEVGLAVRADPGAGNLAQGSVSGYLYPARWLNWIVGSLADWLKYVREAMPVRLSSTGRVFLIPIERFVNVSDDAYDISPANLGSVGFGQQICAGPKRHTTQRRIAHTDFNSGYGDGRLGYVTPDQPSFTGASIRVERGRNRPRPCGCAYGCKSGRHICYLWAISAKTLHHTCPWHAVGSGYGWRFTPNPRLSGDRRRRRGHRRSNVGRGVL